MSFLHKDAKIERLRALPLFRKADDDALEHLASAVDEVEVGPDRELITQGSYHHEGYLIVAGSVTVTVDGDQVATIGAGDIVGELSLFGHGPASATVTTAEQTTVLTIPHNRFGQIVDDNPALLRAIAEDLAERLYNMDAAHL